MLLIWLLLVSILTRGSSSFMAKKSMANLHEFKENTILLHSTLHNSSKYFEPSHLVLRLYLWQQFKETFCFALNLPERDPSRWKYTKQEIPYCIFQKSAGNNKIKARWKVTAHMDFSIIGMADGTYNWRSREGLWKVKSFLLHLE